MRNAARAANRSSPSEIRTTSKWRLSHRSFAAQTDSLERVGYADGRLAVNILSLVPPHAEKDGSCWDGCDKRSHEADAGICKETRVNRSVIQYYPKSWGVGIVRGPKTSERGMQRRRGNRLAGLLHRRRKRAVGIMLISAPLGRFGTGGS